MLASLKMSAENFLIGVLGSTIQASDSFMVRFGLPAKPQRPTDTCTVRPELKLCPDLHESAPVSNALFSKKVDPASDELMSAASIS